MLDRLRLFPRNYHKLALAGLAILGVGIWTVQAAAPPDPQDPELKNTMQRKLDFAKTLLQDLAVEDFEGLRRNAQSLSLLSLESSWNTITTEEYLKQSSAFRRSLDTVRNAAADKNLDRATLGYVDMTIRCVECHKYIRQQKR